MVFSISFASCDKHFFTSYPSFNGINLNNRKLIDLISYFENIDFDLEKEDTIFISQFTESLYDLLSANKESLLLIFECSKGTQYETIQKKLIDIFASKFARRIKNIENPELIARVLIKSLISGLISILKHSNHINEIRSNLMLLTKYHTYGMKTLFA